MRHLTFRQRQLLILLTLAVVFFGIALGALLPYSRDFVVRHATAQLDVAADLKTIEIRHWLDQGSEVARLVSTNHEMQEAFLMSSASSDAEACLYTDLGVMVDIYPYVRSISLLHPTGGQVLLSTDRAQESRERGDMDYFHEGRQALYVSPVVYSVGREAPVLTISTPARGKSGELLTVVAVEMDLADLENTLSSRAGLGRTGRAYLVDAHAFYITVPPNVPAGPLRATAESEGIRRALAGQDGSDTYADPQGVRVLGMYRWIPEARLALLVEIEESELVDEIARIWTVILLAGLGLLVLTAIAIRYLVNWLVTPLERIAAAARALHAGNLGHRAPAGGPDEIGQLAAAFNEMAESLQQSYENLEQLVEQRTAELRAAIEALQESEEKFRSFTESAPVAITIYQSYQCVYANPTAEQITGYTARELASTKLWDLLHPDHKELAIESRRALNRGESPRSEYEAKIITKGGGVKWLDARLEMIEYRGRRAALISAMDVTDRKQAEEALAQQAQELARSNAELEQFAYVISHDLREPLRVVASCMEFMEQRYHGQFDEKADKFIGYAVDGAARMDALIKGLLEYSRVGRQGKDLEPVDGKKLLDHALADLRVTLEESGATVTHGPLPTVMADPLQLGQVFQNLIGNAIKFRSAEPPRIHVSAKFLPPPPTGEPAPSAAEGDGEWLFSIRDNGIGIDPKQAKRIFEVFQRLHTREEYPGIGIGLALCKKIVERHNGRIWVESEPQKGSTFHFTLPGVKTEPLRITQASRGSSKPAGDTQ